MHIGNVQFARRLRLTDTKYNHHDSAQSHLIPRLRNMTSLVDLSLECFRGDTLSPQNIELCGNALVPQPSFFYSLDDVTAIAESCPLLRRFACYVYSINTITPVDAERLRSRWMHLSELRLTLFDATSDAIFL